MRSLCFFPVSLLIFRYARYYQAVTLFSFQLEAWLSRLLSPELNICTLPNVPYIALLIRRLQIVFFIFNVLGSVQYWVRFVSELVRTVHMLVVARLLLASSLRSQYQLVVWGHQIRHINPLKKDMNQRKQVD